MDLGLSRRTALHIGMALGLLRSQQGFWYQQTEIQPEATLLCQAAIQGGPLLKEWYGHLLGRRSDFLPEDLGRKFQVAVPWKPGKP